MHSKANALKQPVVNHPVDGITNACVGWFQFNLRILPLVLAIAGPQLTLAAPIHLGLELENYGTGLNSSLESDTSLLSSKVALTAATEGTFGKNLTSYGAGLSTDPETGVGSTVMINSGLVGGVLGKLYTNLSASSTSAGAFGPVSYAGAQLSWFDTVTTISPTEPIPLPGYLTFNFRLSGALNASVLEAPFSTNLYSAARVFGELGNDSFSFEVEVEKLFPSQLGPFETNTSISTILSVNFPVNQLNGTSSLEWSIGARAEARGGSATARFGNSLDLISILLPNGNTPEAEGFTLLFDSGMPSPNASSVVPLPPTFWLFTSGLLGLFVMRKKMGSNA